MSAVKTCTLTYCCRWQDSTGSKLLTRIELPENLRVSDGRCNVRIFTTFWKQFLQLSCCVTCLTKFIVFGSANFKQCLTFSRQNLTVGKHHSQVAEVGQPQGVVVHIIQQPHVVFDFIKQYTLLHTRVLQQRHAL